MFYIRIISIIILSGLWGCGHKSGEKAAETAKESLENIVVLTDAQIENAHITVGKPESGSMSFMLKVSGIIDVPPQNMISVSFPLGGYLKSTHLLPGMKVKKGQAIAYMEDQSLIQIQQDFLIAKAKLELGQKELERQKTLNATKSVSDKVVDQAANDYQVQKIVFNSLREKLLLIGLDPNSLNENTISRTIPIVSPIDGYVSAVNINIGKYVNPSDILFELVSPTDLHLLLKVFEKDLELVQEGQRIKASMVNNPDKTYNAEVILVSKNVDANRIGKVHCHFEKGAEGLLPGMYMNAEVEVKNNRAVLVPESAVVRFGDGQYVFVDKGNKSFEMKLVKTGNTNNGKTEIISENIDLREVSIITTNAYAALMKLQNKGE